MTVLRTAFESFIDLLIDRIIQFTDYFIVIQKITLSETALFAFAVARFLWILIFGVADDAYDPVFGATVWSIIFGILVIAHFISFFSKRLMIRFYIMCTHAFIWCFLTILAAWSTTKVPVVPHLSVLAGLSIFIAVRIHREIPR